MCVLFAPLQNEVQKYIEELLGDIAQCLAEVNVSDISFDETLPFPKLSLFPSQNARSVRIFLDRILKCVNDRCRILC